MIDSGAASGAGRREPAASRSLEFVYLLLVTLVHLRLGLPHATLAEL